MILKPTKKAVEKVPVKGTEKEQEKPVKRKSNRENKLPTAEYKPMFEPIRVLVRETPSRKDPNKTLKQFIELSVKRFDDDEAKPNLWIQMYQESDSYTGYLSGKTVYLPIDALYDLTEALDDIDKECEKNNITD